MNSDNDDEIVPLSDRALFGGSDIYIPHNYNYMTDEQKQAYIRNVNMTVDEFEEKMNLSLC